MIWRRLTTGPSAPSGIGVRFDPDELCRVMVLRQLALGEADERRCQMRHALHVPVVFLVDGNPTLRSGVVVDATDAGARIQTFAPPVAGRVVVLRLRYGGGLPAVGRTGRLAGRGRGRPRDRRRPPRGPCGVAAARVTAEGRRGSGKPAMTPWLRPTAWPRRVSYAAAAVALGLGGTVSYLALWCTVTSDAPTWADAIRQMAAHAVAWAAITAPGLVVIFALGWAFGRRWDDLLARSVTDSLTELSNLAGHRARVSEELARAARQHTPLALLMVDVDHLKAINDLGGHAAGDEALRLVAESLRRTCRATDHPARVGGDEFAVLAPGAKAHEAMMLAERIRANLERLANPLPGLARVTSVSIGVAALDGARALDADALRAQADRALYRAKAEGRDRAVGPTGVHDAAHLEPLLQAG